MRQNRQVKFCPLRSLRIRNTYPGPPLSSFMPPSEAVTVLPLVLRLLVTSSFRVRRQRKDVETAYVWLQGAAILLVLVELNCGRSAACVLMEGPMSVTSSKYVASCICGRYSVAVAHACMSRTRKRTHDMKSAPTRMRKEGSAHGVTVADYQRKTVHHTHTQCHHEINNAWTFRRCA